MASALCTYRPAGQAWRSFATWTTYCPSRKLSIKSIDRLHVSDESEFWTLMRDVERARAKPPSSYTDLFLARAHLPLARPSVNAVFRRRSFGGWQEVFRRGSIPETVYHYDLVSAYRWAACGGLPNYRRWYRTTDPTRPNAVYICKLRGGEIPYLRSPGEYVITSEERDAFGFDPRPHSIFSIAFDGSVDLRPVFDAIDRDFPSCAKKISRAFWGLWNAVDGPEQVSFRSGATRMLPNIFYNPLWALWITARVKIRIANWLPYTIQAFVDAIHTTVPIDSDGDGVGQWKKKGVYRDFWIRAPGLWHGIDLETGEVVERHCGRPASRLTNVSRGAVEASDGWRRVGRRMYTRQ